MGDLIVQPWKRYGKNRLYVNDPDGARVGWHDLQTGLSNIERSDLADAFVAALHPYVSDSAGNQPAERPTQRAAVSQATPTSHDLAGRRPGEGIRAQADAAWAARKQESRLRAYAGRLLDESTDERAWRRGAEGEEVVGGILEKLRSRGWISLHSVPVGRRGSDIDHVVIGPGGVFTINTKNHRGKRVSVSSRGVWVTGHWQPYIRNSEHEADRASRILSSACGLPVQVTGVVVILAESFRRESSPEDIAILGAGELRRWLKKRSQLLDAETVASVYEQARRGEIWTQ